MGSGAGVSNADTVEIILTQFSMDNSALTLGADIPPTFKLKGEGSLSSRGELGMEKQGIPSSPNDTSAKPSANSAHSWTPA